MNAISLLTNPSVKKLLPLVSEIGDAFGVSDVSASSVDEIVALIRRVLPVVSKLRLTSVSDASVETISDILRTAGIKMADSDIDLWISEIDKFSENPSQSLQEFVMSKQSLGMLQNMLTRGPAGTSDLNIENDPVFDPISGTFNFS